MENKYFFILGNHPAISIAEIYSVLGGNWKYCQPRLSVLIAETAMELNPDELIRRLGGTVKIGKIFVETEAIGKNSLLSLIKTAGFPRPAGKFNFGFSQYGRQNIAFKALAMEYKEHLRSQGISCRWVVSRDPALSSVVVEQNRLVRDGLELVFIEDGQKTLIGKTLAVQPFKELSWRDYARPDRDDRSGMLPPKLAQIMLNLSGIKPAQDKALLDPFCGSGTVLTEAALMGYGRIFGSDISEKAVEDARRNLNWARRNFRLSEFEYRIDKTDAAALSLKIAPNSIDAIVTEPYLGPPRGKIDPDKTIPDLEKLYGAALREFEKVLKPGGRVVMIWPRLRARGFERTVRPDSGRLKELKLPGIFKTGKNIKNKDELVYGRPRQKVWRQIVILEK